MFQEWLCENQVTASVFMVIASIHGSVTGGSLFFWSFKLLFDWLDNRPEKVKTYEEIMAEVRRREKIIDRLKLGVIAILLFAAIVVIGVFGIEVIYAFLVIVGMVLFAFPFIFLIEWLSEKYKWFKKLFTIFGLAFVGIILLVTVGDILEKLYKWWYLMVCG